MPKVAVIVASCVALIAGLILNIAGVIGFDKLQALWAVLGPIVLAAIGLQSNDNATALKEVKARLLTPPANKA
jgi:hypothetical protein